MWGQIARMKLSQLNGRMEVILQSSVFPQCQSEGKKWNSSKYYETHKITKFALALCYELYVVNTVTYSDELWAYWRMEGVRKNVLWKILALTDNFPDEWHYFFSPPISLVGGVY